MRLERRLTGRGYGFRSINNDIRMKKYKKTYAIFHLTEKHTTFYLGKMKVHVSFTGGMVSKKGVTPATITTEDPIVQLAIENSQDFEKGVIILRSQYPIQGEVKVGKNEREEAYKPPKWAEPEQPEEKQTVRTGEPIAIPLTIASLEHADNSEMETNEEVAAEPEEADTCEKEAREESNLEVVEVSCKDVAKQYLQEHFDERPAPLRTIADVQACAAKYGITFNFV